MHCSSHCCWRGSACGPIRKATSCSPTTALDRASCVILDDRKPHLDGFDVMAKLRERHLKAPVILLAGYTTPRLRHRAAAAGFRAVLEKPLLNNILLDTLRMIVADDAAGQEGGERETVAGTAAGRRA